MSSCTRAPRCRGRPPSLVTDQPGSTALRGALVTLPARRWIGPTLGVLIALTLLIGVGGYRVYVHPRVDNLKPGERVDAVVALGGLIESATYAQTLVERGAAPVLVLSDPYPDGEAPAVDQACASRPSGYRVICFRPDPSTTRGEARQIQALAQRYGWTRVAVVAPAFHVSRARLIIERCYPQALFMLAVPMHHPWYAWTYQFVRQSAGYVKTAIHRSC
jgi:uncharacterized SAM-binding protein YcdF (DUF218 family)